ncbi:hypothetical protein ABFV05_017217 [Capra hircus]
MDGLPRPLLAKVRYRPSRLRPSVLPACALLCEKGPSLRRRQRSHRFPALPFLHVVGTALHPTPTPTAVSPLATGRRCGTTVQAVSTGGTHSTGERILQPEQRNWSVAERLGFPSHSRVALTVSTDRKRPRGSLSPRRFRVGGHRIARRKIPSWSATLPWRLVESGEPERPKDHSSECQQDRGSGLRGERTRGRSPSARTEESSPLPSVGFRSPQDATTASPASPRRGAPTLVRNGPGVRRSLTPLRPRGRRPPGHRSRGSECRGGAVTHPLPPNSFRAKLGGAEIGGKYPVSISRLLRERRGQAKTGNSTGFRSL